MRQKLTELKGETDAALTAGDFNTPPSETNRSNRQKITTDITEHNNITNQMDISDIYRLFHPATAEYTFFSSSDGTLIKTNDILGYETSSNNNKKMFLNHISALRPQRN